MRMLLTVLLVWMGFHCSAQCPYDLNGDGQVTMGGGESLAVLADLGQDTLAAGSAVDFNNNGLVDILDVLDWGRHVGQDCPNTDIPETDDRILGLSLSVHHVHDVAVTGIDTVPEGFVTYRLYLEVTDNSDRITGVFGIDESPLLLSSTAPLWNSVFGAHNAKDINTVFFDIDPSLAYDSWWSLGYTPENEQDVSNLAYESLIGYTEDWFNQATDIVFDSPTGGGNIALGYTWQHPEYSNLRCVGQFTLPADATFEGIINVEAVHVENNDVISYERKLGLTFSTDNLAELGCTDPDAENYSPAATLDDGTCSYFGDLDGDGVIDTEDLLALLGNFGCTSCNDLDLDGGGIVGVGDLLIILGLL